MNKILFFISLSLTLISFNSCRTYKEPSNPIITKSKPQIVFLVLKMHKEGKKIEIVSINKKEGEIKKEPQIIPASNFLTIEIFENGKLNNSILLDHPLYKSIEYLDAQNPSSKTVELEKEEFLLRFQVNSNEVYLKIFETLNNNTKTEISTLKI